MSVVNYLKKVQLPNNTEYTVKDPTFFTGTTEEWNLLSTEQKQSYKIVNLTDDEEEGDISEKADKVTGATAGNLAGLDSNGNLTDSGWNGAKDTTSISGNPISISGLKSNQLAINPIITFEPIQAGSGTPSPSNIRAISGYDKVDVLSCGKNIWVDGDVSVSNVAYVKVYLSHPIPAGTYKVSAILSNNVTSDARVSFRRSDDTGIKSTDVVYNASGRSMSDNVEIEETAYIVYFYYTNPGVSGSRTWSDIMIAPSSTDQTYESPVKATSISESLGQTVYGATHEVRTGKAKVTHGVVDLGTLEWAKNTANNVFYASFSGNANRASDAKGYKYVSDRFVYGTEASDLWNNGATGLCVEPNAISSVLRIYARHTAYDSMTAEQFKTAMSGSLLAYELEISIEIQLTPHEISLLKDYAYVSTNGTSISLDYHNGEMASLSDVASLNEVIENQLNEREPLEINLANVDSHLSGKLFMVRRNGIVTVNFYDLRTTATGSYAIIPDRYRPIMTNARVFVTNLNQTEIKQIFIKTNGDLDLNSVSTNTYYYGTLTYVQ